MRRQSRDRKWHHVTSGDQKSPGSHLEVALEGQKLAYSVHFTFYKAVASRRRPSRDRKWRHVTSGDPEVTSFDRKLPGSGCRRPKTPIYCTFQFLQGGRSWEEAVTWQKMMSRDLRWPKVTLKWRYLTGSHLEVSVEDQKLAYTVHFTFYKAVARRRRLSRDRKWRHVTSGDRKWPGNDVIWPEVSWKRL